MEFEWDENKNLSNIEKHGISFEAIASVFSNPFIEWASPEPKEARRIRLVKLKEVIFAVVYTMRQGRYRIISARKARDHEKEIYHQILS